jgi:ribonucleoside-diphosphate reductase alpha chain
LTQEKIERTQLLHGKTYKDRCACGTLYVTINELDDKPFEIFITIGKNGGCMETMLRVLGLTVAHGLQGGTPLQNYIHAFKGVKCHNPLTAIQNNGNARYSCVDAVAKVLMQYMDDKYGLVPPVEEPKSLFQQQELTLSKPEKIKPITKAQYQKADKEMSGLTCQECGGLVIIESGCDHCVDCGFSKNCS